MLKAQSAAEYVTLIAMIFVLVASLMLVAFRQQEVTLALAASRVACTEYNSFNTSVNCFEMKYFYVGGQNVTIVPYTNTKSADINNEIQKAMLRNLVNVFRPGSTVPGHCFSAGYYSYCYFFAYAQGTSPGD